MSSSFSRNRIPFGTSAARGLRFLAPAVVALRLLSAPGPADASATLPEMARLEAAERLDRIQVTRLARWYGTLGLSREATEFVERRIGAGDLSRDEAVPVFEGIVRELDRRGDADALLAACDVSRRNGASTPAILYPCASALRLKGRAAESLALLSRIRPEDSRFPYARFATAQIAAEAGDFAAALAILGEIKGRTAAVGESDPLGARVALAEANLLLMSGQSRGASPAASSAGPSGDSPSPRARVVEGIRAGEAAEGRGEIEDAVHAYRRSLETAEAALSAPSGPGVEAEGRAAGPSATFRSLLNAHEDMARNIARNAAAGSAPPAAEIRDLLADLLCLDFMLRNAADSLPPLPSSPRVPLLAPERRERIVTLIEKLSLGGMETDRLLEKSGEAVEVFENLAHPIRRFRNLADLEKSQAAMEALAERAGASREALIASLESARGRDLLPVLRDVDAYLKDMDAVRSAWDGTTDLVRRRFDIFPKGRAGSAEGDAAVAAAREGATFDADMTADLRRFARDLEDRARSVARDRDAETFRKLRAMAARRYADALLRAADRLEDVRPEGWRLRFWQALGEEAAVLGRDALDPASRAELAVRTGLLAVRSLPPWERFPEKAARGPEEDVIRKVLPMLESGSAAAGRDERAQAVSSLLRWRIGDPGAAVAARAFLKNSPGSPMAGHLSLRLGHDALRARRFKQAEDAYRDAAARGPAEVTAAASYMLGWLAYKRDDAARALRELAVPLAAPLAAGPDAAAFERDVISLAIRCFLQASGDGPAVYPPVRDRTPAGKRILAGLARAEARRGRMGRAAELHADIARAYAGDGDGAAHEIESVECLIRAGMEREAMASAFALAKRFGRRASPGDGRGEGRPEEGVKALARLLRDLAERRFAEGERSGRPEPMADAAAAIRELFALTGAGAAGDPELRLKWAVAAMRGGDRAGGVRLLEEIASGGAPRGVAERAALLHADAMVAGYEAKDTPAPKAEASLLFLLRRFPGEKATALAMRGAAAFYTAGDCAQAARAAAAVEAGGTAVPATRDEAALLRARALLFLGDFAAARAKAEEVLGRPAGSGAAESRTHARDVVVLASGKDAAARAAAGDRTGAAALLERLAARFPDLPDAADHLLDAMSHYRDGSDADGTIRTGLAFLRMFPGRVESLDVAAAVGPLLEKRGKGAEAAGLYARMSELFPRDDRAPRFLFRAARLAEREGDREAAGSWYAAYSRRFGEPRWVAAYAALSTGLFAWRDGNPGAIGLIEKGLRLAGSAAGPDVSPDLHERAGKARIAVGDHWAARFREIALVAPLEKSLARKQRCFRKSLDAYDEAAGGAGPLEVRLEASRSAADLYVEFGRAIMESERPAGMEAGERELYENALAARSRKYIERALEGYADAIERLKKDGMPAGLAEPFRTRLETVGRLLDMPPEARVRR